MISWKLRRWRILGAAAVVGLAACGQPAPATVSPDATDDGGERGETGEGGETGESGGEGGESGESGEGGNSGSG